MCRSIITAAAATALLALAACGDDGEPAIVDQGTGVDSTADGVSNWPDSAGQQDGSVQWDGSGPPVDSGVKDTGSSKDSYVPPAAKCNGTAKLYLAEVSTGQPDYLALINKGSAAVNLAGFKLEMDGISHVSYTFAAGTSVKAGATQYVFEYTYGKKSGDINTTKNIPFYDDLNSNAVALYDASGNLLDFVPIGKKAVSVPAGVTAGLVAWPKSYDAKKQSLQRKAYTGACPTFKASDWTAKAKTRTGS